MNQWFLKPSQLLMVALGIVCVVSWVVIGTPLAPGVLQPRFDWPDETANYFWINHYAQTGNLVVQEPLNAIAENQIHPRSFNVRDDGSLVPGSFIGMILLFGMLARIIGAWAVPLVIPILACGAIAAWYGILRIFFDQRLAFVSSLLLLFHPAWWYYAASPLLPNISFVSFVLIGLWALLSSREEIWKWGAAGLALGAALAIRPSEFIWVGGVAACTMAYALTHYKIKKFAAISLFFVVAVVMMVPTFFQQRELYGNALVSGYTQLQNTSATTCAVCSVVKGTVMPFGFHPVLIAHNVARYLFLILWWWTIAVVIGLAVVITQKQLRKTWFWYSLFAGILSLWLAVYYGSWEFTDQQTVNLNTLGLSYVRYWLPIYVLMTPFVALGIQWLSNLVPAKFKNITVGMALAILFIPSATLVLFSRPDSLIPVHDRISGYYVTAQQINSLTEPDAIIITMRKDKVFFPERGVIHTFEVLSNNTDLQNIVDKLIDHVPVYYYALAPESTLKLSDQLQLKPVQSFGSEVLYRVIRSAIK